MQKEFVLVSFLITLISTGIIVSPIHAAEPKGEAPCQECLTKRFNKTWFEHSGCFKKEESRKRSDSSTGTVSLTGSPVKKKEEVWVARSAPFLDSKLLAEDENVKLPHKCSHLYKEGVHIVCRDLFFWMVNVKTEKCYGTLNAFLGRDNNLILSYFLEHDMSEELLAGALDLAIDYFLENAKRGFGADVKSLSVFFDDEAHLGLYVTTQNSKAGSSLLETYKSYTREQIEKLIDSINL